MARFIPLDAGVIGLPGCSPSLPAARDCVAWLARMDPVQSIVVLSDVMLYEVQPELGRLDAAATIAPDSFFQARPEADMGRTTPIREMPQSFGVTVQSPFGTENG